MRGGEGKECGEVEGGSKGKWREGMRGAGVSEGKRRRRQERKRGRRSAEETTLFTGPTAEEEGASKVEEKRDIYRCLKML